MNSPAKDKKSKSRKSAKGLGRGLDALFGDDEDVYPAVDVDTIAPPSSEASEGSNLTRKTIGIERLVPDPNQPRKFFDDKALKTLADSIEQYGLLQPILVRPSKDHKDYYEIVAGERRWRASQKAQLHEVPVVIRELDEAATFQIALVENLQRQDLTAIEEAKGYKRLNDQFDYSHDEIGKFVGKSRSHVANMIRLLELPDHVQTMVELNDIAMGHARALLKSDNAHDLALQVVDKNLSVRETEKLVAEYTGRDIKHRSSGTKTGQAGFEKKDANLLSLEKQLSDALGLNVQIDMKADHKAGRVSIDFRDLSQLDEIIKRLEKPSGA